MNNPHRFILGSLCRFNKSAQTHREQYVPAYCDLADGTLGMLLEVTNSEMARSFQHLRIVLVETGKVIVVPAWTRGGQLYWDRLTKRQLREQAYEAQMSDQTKPR